MKLRSNLKKRSIALTGLVALLGIVAVTLTPATAKAFVGVEIGPIGIGVGTTPGPTYYYPSTYYYPLPSVDVYGR
jgi:hypothetical protein